MIALYHFITFITLLHLSLYRFYRIYHLITFLMKKPSLLPVIIGTGFGSGFSPFAPGTAGALLATLIWFGLSYLVSSACLLWLTVALILVFTLAGIWAANRLEASWGEDPSRVVVDEMVGVWIALLAAPAGHVWYALGAFVLFRLFDIFKPLGIRRMESLPGGIGVMMDDILSGVYGFIIKWQRCVVAPFCLDLLQGPDFCAIRKLCRFSGDYPSGKGFCCFLSLCHIHGFRGRRHCKLCH